MSSGAVELRLGRWQDVLADVECDALIVDAPYSERTHSGHDSAVGQVNPGETRDNRVRYKRGLEPQRRELNYEAWGRDEVATFVQHWASRVRGWIVTLTDHELASHWAAALESAGRYVFAPLAAVAPGSRVRLTGDGPAQWSVWCIVSRPSSLSKWGSLPGAYVVPPGYNDRRFDGSCVVGGKPLWLMQAIIRDYSRPGDLICDPCAGGGTTLLAAAIEGRRAIGAEMLPEHYELAQQRLKRGYTPTMFPE